MRFNHRLSERPRRERTTEPEGPEDERFVYVVTAAGVEVVRESAVAVDSEREAVFVAGTKGCS